jgi:hypothetical protein
MSRGLVEEMRAVLSTRLGARRGELEQGIFARVRAVEGDGVEDDGYAEGVRNAVSAGVGHCLAGVGSGEDELEPAPGPVLAQARRAARNGVPADVILRGCFAAHTAFSGFVVEEAKGGIAPQGSALRTVLHTQAALFERLVVAVMGEYARERSNCFGSLGPHRLDLVRKLLADEPVDPSELAYELDEWHVGALARGDRAAAVLREVARAADRRLLLVHPDRRTAWAWFGGRRRVGAEEIAKSVPPGAWSDLIVALGEPARGVKGWRLTHEQASAALQISRHGGEGAVLYADVGLLASLAQDRVLAASLHQIYLAPLSDGRDGGVALRETLRAYFSAGRNTSSAAAALGVSRQTVGNRLRAIEEKLDRTIETCAPEIEIALRLEGLSDS